MPAKSIGAGGTQYQTKCRRKYLFDLVGTENVIYKVAWTGFETVMQA